MTRSSLHTTFQLFLALCIISIIGDVSSAKQKSPWRQQFVVQDTRVDELSGLSESIRYPGYFWANNDSNDSLRCFLISPEGKTVAVINLVGFANIDTESVRVGGTPEQSFVYVGDIGDNRSRRAEVAIYRFVEPQIDVEKFDQNLDIEPEKMILKYGDGKATDAETLLVDNNHRIGIVTKSLLGSKLWITPQPFVAGAQTLQPEGTVPLREWRQRDQPFSALFTDGVISNDGKSVALLTYKTVYIWQISEGVDLQGLAKVLSTPPQIRENLPELKQPEALSFRCGNAQIAVSSEGLNPPVMVIGHQAKSKCPF